jgi:hypothetical protein
MKATIARALRFMRAERVRSTTFEHVPVLAATPADS